MAKTPKVKKREVSVRSRTARRGASPPPKELAVKAPVEETDYKPWLHNAHNAGISKKRKSKKLTHAQRLRQEQAQEKALAVANKLEKKVQDSKKSARNIQSRAADWDALNGKLTGVTEAKKAVERKDGGKDGQVMHTGDVVLPDLEPPEPIHSGEMSGAEEDDVKAAPTPKEGIPAWASMHAEADDLVDDVQ